VYAADEPAFGRRVAVKVLTARIGDDEARRGFERECRAMGALSGHPHIVAVHRGGTTPSGEPFIVMEFMSGGSLADRMARGGPLPWSEVLDIGVLLAGALETAHRAGILHLDVKPANILMSRFAEPALGDFGISRLPGLTVTLDGRVRATATYSAPERLMNGEATVATDLYGLGATLFALLSGVPAFAGETGEEIVVTVARILREPVPDLRARGVPGELAEVVERLMAKEPGDRPASAADTASLLQAVQRATGRSVTRPVIEGERTAHLPKAAPGSAPEAATSVVTPAKSPAVAPVGPSATTTAQPGPPSNLPASWPPPAHAHPPWIPAHPAADPPWAASPANYRPPPTPPAPRRGGRGRLIGGVAAALVVVVALVTTFVLLGRASPPGPVAPTPTPTAAAGTPPPPTSAPGTAAVEVAPGITHPATADVATVLDAYVAGINERRYSDSFALLSPDNPTAKKGVQAWIDAESTTQIRDARLRSVSDGPTGAVNAEMTFASTQSAELGPDGQTCTQWDLVYAMVGPGPDWRIRLASSRSDPVAC
jgi:serine/threonine-protein kinase PknK